MLPQSRLPLLITRPEPQASRFAATLAARYGDRVRLVKTPLLAARFLRPTLPPGPFGALVLTSETGLRAALALGVDLPGRAFCVGAHTAALAAEAGFAVEAAEGDAPSLLRLLLARPEAAPFLHLHGREVTGDIAGDLRRVGLPAEGAVVYAQEAQALTETARAQLSGMNAVLVPLFSPRSARLFRAALDGGVVRAPLRVAALSPAVAVAFGDFPGAAIAVAQAPAQAELLLALDSFVLRA